LSDRLAVLHIWTNSLTAYGAPIARDSIRVFLGARVKDHTGSLALGEHLDGSIASRAQTYIGMADARFSW
jgi:hypothetical protein